MLTAAAIGPEFGANQTVAGHQSDAAVAADADGDFVIVWSGNGTGDPDGVYARRYAANGAAQGGEFRVNTTVAGNQLGASVGMSVDGDFVVAWTSYGQDAAGTYGVYARLYNAAGVPQSGELAVNTTTASNQRQAAVDMDAAGDFVIAWESYSQDAASTFGVYARRYDAAGVPQGGEIPVNTTTAGDQRAPSVAADARGGFVIAWQSNTTTGQDGSNYGVYARRFNPAGQPQSGELPVNTTTANIQNMPSAGMDVAGDFIIAWQSSGQDGSGFGVYARRFDAAGTPQGGEIPVNTTTADQQRAPSVAVDARGDFAVAWQSNAPTQDGSGTGVYARQFNTAGAPQTDEFRVNSTIAGNQGFPSLAMDAAGDFVVAWQSYGQDAASTQGVYAQRYDEPTDTAGPLVGKVTASGVAVTPTRTLVQNLPQFTVAFGENLDAAGEAAGVNSVTNPANWALAYKGQDISSRISSIGFGLNAETRKYEANLTISPPLTYDGSYVLTAKQVIRDVAGNALDGNVDGLPGGDFVLPFAIRQPVATGPELQVNSTTAGHQRLPSVAVDAAGDFVVAWQSQYQDGNSEGVYVRRYNAAGVPQSGELPVNIVTAGSQESPAVAMDAAGDFVVAWQSYRQDGSNFGIYARWYNAAGVPQTDELPVNTTTANNQRFPSVAMDPAGGFVIAWESYSKDRNGYDVYARRYNAAGVPRTAEFRVNSNTVLSQRYPSVAMDAAGDFVVAWLSDVLRSGLGVYARRYDAAGAPLNDEFRVNTTLATASTVPSVAMDPAGDFVVAWQSYAHDGGDFGVFARRYNADGLPQADELPVSTTAARGQRVPSVAMDAVGDFIVAWESYDQDDGYNSGVYARRYNAAGVPQTGELQANTTTADFQLNPSVGMDAAGSFVVAWESFGQDVSDHSIGVYARRYTANGPPTTLGIAAINAVEGGQSATIPLPRVFADPNEPSSALTYSVIDDTNASLFSSTPIDAGGTLTLNYAPGHTGQATITIRATDSGGLFVDTSFGVTVTPVSSAPTLSSISINDGSAQRSQVKTVTLTFNGAVTLAPGATTLQLLNSGGSGANDGSNPTDASSALASPTTGDGGKTWVYAFAAASAFVQKASTGASTGSLIDGIFRLSINPTKVTAGSVAMMAAPAPLTFHRLFGDVNGSKNVNTADFGPFRNAFGKGIGQAGFDAAFDFDNTGTVNNVDFGQFRGRYGKVFTY